MVASSDDDLSRWLQDQTPARSGPRGARPLPAAVGIRFAFYGRISTLHRQDIASSLQWQYDNATRVTAGAGTIVRTFFDAGYSRSLPWAARPQAAALLAAVSDPRRDFDAIVVGEYERGFNGDQLLRLLPFLRRHGVSVWLPELHGPVDADDPEHRALIHLLGHQAQREVLRARFRTTAAMRVQVRDQGRHLGGRAPYGYRLVDAGPHPTPAHARWGRQVQRLDPDPATAHHVTWIFEQRLAGHSTTAITAMLNRRRVPPPSGPDPDLDPRPDGWQWSPRTVATILANPRYTGRQVWNRQGIDHQETRPGDRQTSQSPVRRHNPQKRMGHLHLPSAPRPGQ